MLFLTVVVLVVGCTTTSTPDTTPPTTATTEPVATTTIALPPEHRIGVRQLAGVGEFYEATTGERFTPRGMNYHIWADDVGGGYNDALLTVDHYDPAVVEADLAAMATYGFNTVRIFLDGCHPASGCVGGKPTDTEVNPEFLDNLADFLRVAGDHGMVVLVASNTLPDNSWWLHQTASLQDSQFESANNEFLNPEAVPIYVDYWRKVVAGIVERGATRNILGYELRQEHHFHDNFAPLSLTSGQVSTANGATYDMASEGDKDRMVDEGLTYWADTIRAEIRSVDSSALVTVGFFTPNAPNAVMPPDDRRLVRTSYFLRNSTMDFFDLHHYPGNGVNDTRIWENFDILDYDDKPLILGEFGAIKEWWPDAATGAAAVMGLEVGACRVGFDGFIVWGWRGDLLQDIYWAGDGDREVAQVTAPLNRSDPCEYGVFDFVRFNVALTATVTASSELPGAEAAKAIDGGIEHWNAADRAPQWIEIALPTPAIVDSVELWVAQDPAGPSIHELWIQTGGDFALVHTFEGVTTEGDVLVYEPETPKANVTAVRVETTTLGDLAPAWHELFIYSPFPPG